MARSSQHFIGISYRLTVPSGIQMAAPILEPILVVGLGCSLGVRFEF